MGTATSNFSQSYSESSSKRKSKRNYSTVYNSPYVIIDRSRLYPNRTPEIIHKSFPPVIQANHIDSLRSYSIERSLSRYSLKSSRRSLFSVSDDSGFHSGNYFCPNIYN